MRRSKRLRDSGKDEVDEKHVDKKHKSNWTCDAKDCEKVATVQGRDKNWICDFHWAIEGNSKPCTCSRKMNAVVVLGDIAFCEFCRPICLGKGCFLEAEVKTEKGVMCEDCAFANASADEDSSSSDEETEDEEMALIPTCEYKECKQDATEYHDTEGHMCKSHAILFPKCKECKRRVCDANAKVFGYCQQCAPVCDANGCHRDSMIIEDGEFRCDAHRSRCVSLGCGRPGTGQLYEGGQRCDTCVKQFDHDTKKRLKCSAAECTKPCVATWDGVPYCSSPDCAKKGVPVCMYKGKGCDHPNVEVRAVGDLYLCYTCLQGHDKDGKRRKCFAFDCKEDGAQTFAGVPYCSEECQRKMHNLSTGLCDKCIRLGVLSLCECDVNHCIKCCKEGEKDARKLSSVLKVTSDFYRGKRINLGLVV